MSLRLRLILVILVVVIPASVASLLSYRLHLDIQQELAQLSPYSKTPLDSASIVGRELSFEGRWGDGAAFVATSIEELPQSSRPKLRGAIQAVQRDGGSLTMFGRTIRVTSDTEFEEAASLDALAPGQRAEITCKTEALGEWVARKVKTLGLKQNDKIKGPITRAATENGAVRLEIEGLPIVVPSKLQIESPRGPVHRMELTSRMALAVQSCLTGTNEYLKDRYRLRDARASGDARRASELESASADVEDQLEDGSKEFVQVVTRTRSIAEQETRALSDAGATELQSELKDEVARWLNPLEKMGSRLQSDVARFVGLAKSDVDEAQVFLIDTLEPRLRGEILPLIHAYQLEIEEELAEEVHGLARHSETAARLTILASAIGLALALTLGYFVARSIAKPIGELRAAARRIGDGDLSARVACASGDEIGLLARTFNQMAERLAATTVSIGNLNEVIDSMAGALFLLGPEGTISSVNPAAAKLLGYQPGELIGMPFETICPGMGTSLVQAGKEGLVASSERRFERHDGTIVPVSLSSSALRGDHLAVRGYACLAQDLTGRKQLEEDLRRSLSEKELLLREVHHRVKNNLQVISSLLELQSRTVSDPQALEKFQDSQDRIRSMVLIHEQLYRSRNLESIHMPTYLELLVANLSLSHVDRPGRIDMRVEVDDICLPLDRALSCGLIVNELVTNAFKHAFPADAPGEIRVECQRTPTNAIALEVSDNGRGFVETPSREVGMTLGMGLVEALAKQLHGRLHIASEDGAVFRVEFPSSSLAMVG